MSDADDRATSEAIAQEARRLLEDRWRTATADWPEAVLDRPMKVAVDARALLAFVEDHDRYARERRDAKMTIGMLLVDKGELDEQGRMVMRISDATAIKVDQRTKLETWHDPETHETVIAIGPMRP
jgi:hypothetical protein